MGGEHIVAGHILYNLNQIRNGDEQNVDSLMFAPIKF